MFNTKKYYKQITKEKFDIKEVVLNFLKAFISGGILSIIGQGLLDIYMMIADKEKATILMTITIIIIAAFLTAIGIYDRLGQLFKCGLAIPITGFVNASVSSALEYKKEGIVLGIGANLFKLSGSVIALGTTSAIIVSTIRYVLWLIK